MIRTVRFDDVQAICDIYNEYVAHTSITFEELPVSTVEMQRRIEKVRLPWLVYEEGGTAVGYAYAAQWKERSAYRHTVECTIYLSPEAAGRQIGTQLYDALFTALREFPIHALIGVIALPNAASIALHEKFGFEKAAYFREVGRKFDKWVDVGYWIKVQDNF